MQEPLNESGRFGSPNAEAWRQDRIQGLVNLLVATVHQLAAREVSHEEAHMAVEQVALPLLNSPEAGHDWIAVPRGRLMSLLSLIDPEPVIADRKAIVFRNPMAAEVLTRVSAEVRAMVKEAREQEHGSAKPQDPNLPRSPVQNMIGEKLAVDARLAEIKAYEKSPLFSNLDADGQRLVQAQREAMEGYTSLLGLRILRFSPSA